MLLNEIKIWYFVGFGTYVMTNKLSDVNKGTKVIFMKTKPMTSRLTMEISMHHGSLRVYISRRR